MKLDILNRIYAEGIVAILRADHASGLVQAAEALKLGGVTVMEVTLTTPGALDVIRQAADQLGTEVLIGAGSVLDATSARLAILAGARFLVTPALDIDVIRMGNRYSIPVIMGCYTPSEIKIAWEQGADLIKLFPASQGGLPYLKALQAPLPQVQFVPTGGIDLDNVGDYLTAGAFAVGVGSTLISADLLAASDYDEITRRAHAFRQIVEQQRRSHRILSI